jgi:uncharacterized protein YegL
MTKPNSTHILIVLDRSGSMAPIASDVQGGLNTFIEEQKKVPGDCTFSLVDFDHEYRTLVEWTDIQKVKPITNYEPRGNTALFDAVCRAVDELGVRLAALPEEERPSKVIVVVQTDGQENASVYRTLANVRERITHQREQYGWDFVFLGANMDAFAAGAAMGISGQSTAQWQPTKGGIAATYNVTARSVRRARAGGQSMNYTPDEQEEIKSAK